MSKITIAIDGYSSCGKSTLAKALAGKLGYAYVDSGAMYRSVTLHALRQGIIKDHGFIAEQIIKILPEINLSFKFNPGTGSSETFLNGENVEKELRHMIVSENVSKVSAIHEVRVKMIAIQRELGKNKGIVMDGRDIGTNVFPDAELKLFMTADPDIRTQRRYDEMLAKGQHPTFLDVKKNLLDRDYEDTHRKENPLTQAEDAIVLDNTELNREQQLEYVMKLITDLTLSVN
ncbi:MAG: cytidylate kinase [Bacteroidetes bacterium]|jgi:cytidylate kinase|nr:cytidylate kinase [Bacteroidota bacterium]